jgi:amino acid adenylation domain-containing protein
VVVNRKNVEDIYPLSPLQEGMLFHAVYSAGKGAYVEQWPLLLEGALDVDAFGRAFQRVVDRHAALRTAFVWENVPRPLQVVFRAAQVPVERLDWSDADEAAWRARLDALAADRRAAGFALGTPPLVRLTLVRLSGERHLLLFAFHHLLMDGWSAPLVFDEWWQAYEAVLRGQTPQLPPAPRFRDYIGWLQAQDASAAEGFWRETLRGFTDVTPLPLDRGGADVAEEHAAESLRIAGAAGARLLALARALAVTPNTVVQGAWALLLARYAGRGDVVFGATVSGRPAGLPGVERMVGLFINTLPVRVRVDGARTVRAWLSDLQQQQADARQHEHARLLDVQGWSEAPREHPLFGSLVVFENYPLGQGGGDEDDGGLRMTQLPAPEGSTYPLTLVVAPGADGVELRLSYDVRRFAASAARRMLDAMDAILRSFGDAPDGRLAEVDALPAADRPLLAAWAAGEAVDGTPARLHDAFERRAAETPDAVAVAWAGGRMTYAALDARAGALARRLVDAGVRPESAVGVCLPRGAEAVVALLAVLKAGGVYLPLDPAYPAERLRWMLDDARAAALIADDAGHALLAGFAGPVLSATTDGDRGESTFALSHSRTFALPFHALPSHGAYLVYTSGSTGLPKGVLVQHGEAAAHARAAARAYGLTASDRVLQFAAPGFDVALEQVMAPLSAGAGVVLRGAEVPGAAELAALLRGERVTVFNPPTAYWHALAGDAEAVAQVRGTVRLTLVGGEAMLDGAARRWLAAADGDDVLLNVYGPTETVVTSTAQAVDGSALGAGATVPVGRPLPGRAAYVLDDAGRPVPVGAPGELHVGGLLARGYVRRPALTAERFVPDAFSGIAGARLYRTGDRARWTEAGALEFLGRADLQVKVRGFRVELGEVEAALLRLPGIRGAAADVRGGALAAYVVSSAEVDADAVRAALGEALPEHMVPSAVVTVDALPLTPNGKLDRAALPDPRPSSTRAHAAPETETERELAALWAELLGVDGVGAEDSFFALGGHSLLAMQLMSRVRQSMEIELPLRTLFEAPRLRALAARVDALRDELLAARLGELDEAELDALLAAAETAGGQDG